MSSVHLPALVESVPQERDLLAVEPVYFVIQRQNGHWSLTAKIMAIFYNEVLAETHAANLKDQHPQLHFGVAALHSEARTVANPVQIVRVVNH